MTAPRNGTWHHIRREANMAARIMAHAEKKWNECVVWLDRPPVYLIDRLQMDVEQPLLINESHRFHKKNT
ncbi:unnamed protein product [Linum tenue]|uniref:RNase H type-1 domain-containing protein n=1 Tax=Linum tenue TaxID=586396 RepID=A0AAV0P0W2_9ROSI|nr:unnamed protein product [Linum tenue]